MWIDIICQKYPVGELICGYRTVSGNDVADVKRLAIFCAPAVTLANADIVHQGFETRFLSHWVAVLIDTGCY